MQERAYRQDELVHQYEGMDQGKNYCLFECRNGGSGKRNIKPKMVPELQHGEVAPYWGSGTFAKGVVV
ncbi:hypothetical protein J2S74_005191 [Evansella vedderi]|uniref:Uncharacterized protein n=1 Tax=Evansella vedderi TaxID=38282 RepID=A0ABU0A2L0_9BACI|nr:hypothetical protein [Evansella vedderi]MDQ0257729.1 hypothetical protein [Evansella vedderi]